MGFPNWGKFPHFPVFVIVADVHYGQVSSVCGDSSPEGKSIIPNLSVSIAQCLPGSLWNILRDHCVPARPASQRPGKIDHPDQYTSLWRALT